jgi:predicted Zn-dependent peptidase
VSTIRDIEATSLPNGIRVVSECVPHVRSVSVGLWIGTGARHETPKQTGISHFIEHMVFKGTANRSAEQIAREVDSCGGNLDAYTSKELVSYNSKVLDEHLPRAFDVLADLVLNPQFREEDIEKEKGVILEELKMETDNPEYLVHETFCRNFWRNHSLGRSIIGSKATIKGFNQDAVRGYYSSVYEPANILITAAGHLEHKAIVDLATQYFAGLTRNATRKPEPTPVTNSPLVLKNKRMEQVHVCMGVPAYPIADKRRYVSYLLNTILGGGMSSRLFQNIREKNGLAYAVFSELNLYRDTGCLALYAGTSIDNARRVIDMTIEECRRIRTETVPDEELRRAKDHLKGSLALSLESTSSRMSNLARQELFFGKFISVDEMMECVEAVTAEELLAMAGDLFTGRQMGLTILGKLNGLTVLPEDLVC